MAILYNIRWKHEHEKCPLHKALDNITRPFAYTPEHIKSSWEVKRKRIKYCVKLFPIPLGEQELKLKGRNPLYLEKSQEASKIADKVSQIIKSGGLQDVHASPKLVEDLKEQSTEKVPYIKLIILMPDRHLRQLVVYQSLSQTQETGESEMAQTDRELLEKALAKISNIEKDNTHLKESIVKATRDRSAIRQQLVETIEEISKLRTAFGVKIGEVREGLEQQIDDVEKKLSDHKPVKEVIKRLTFTYKNQVIKETFEELGEDADLGDIAYAVWVKLDKQIALNTCFNEISRYRLTGSCKKEKAS